MAGKRKSPGTNAAGNFSDYMAPQVKITAAYDREFAEALENLTQAQGIPAGSLGERNPALDHGTMIPLYFVNKYYSDYKLVRIGLSGLSPAMHYRLGMCITKTAGQLDRKTVIIASGDLSHKLLAEGPYGFAQEGVDFDRQLTEALGHGDFLKLLQFPSDFLAEAAECGLKSFQIMAGTLDKKEVASHLLSYEGPFGVGYGVASFLPHFPPNACEGDFPYFPPNGREEDFPFTDNPARNFLEQYLEWDEKCRQAMRAQECPHVRLARQTIEH